AAGRLVRAQLAGLLGGVLALVLMAWVSSSGFTDAAGPIDWILIALVYVLGMLGTMVLVYTLAGWVRLLRGEDASARQERGRSHQERPVLPGVSPFHPSTRRHPMSGKRFVGTLFDGHGNPDKVTVAFTMALNARLKGHDTTLILMAEAVHLGRPEAIGID